MRVALTLTEQTEPGAAVLVFVVAVLALVAGLVLGVILSVRGITRSDDRVARLAEHQRDPAVRAWLAALPEPRYPRKGASISHRDYVDWGAGEW